MACSLAHIIQTNKQERQTKQTDGQTDRQIDHKLTSKEADPAHVLTGHKCGGAVEADRKGVQKGGVRSQDYDGGLLGGGRTTLVVDPVETKTKEEETIKDWRQSISVDPEW